MIEIRPAAEVDPERLLAHIVGVWHAESVVAHDEVMYPARHRGFVAVRDGEIVGHVSFRGEGARCEIVSIDAQPQHAGIGSLLMDAAIAAAREEGYETVWLTTTNDNLDAIRFYQRRGFRFCALRPGAVDRTRKSLKPEIPEVGSYGIRIRDELDLDLDLL